MRGVLSCHPAKRSVLWSPPTCHPAVPPLVLQGPILACREQPTDASPWARVAAGVPASAWRPGRAFPFGGRPATAEDRTHRRSDVARDHRERGSTSTADQRGDGASPVAWAFQQIA